MWCMNFSYLLTWTLIYLCLVVCYAIFLNFISTLLFHISAPVHFKFNRNLWITLHIGITTIYIMQFNFECFFLVYSCFVFSKGCYRSIWYLLVYLYVLYANTQLTSFEIEFFIIKWHRISYHNETKKKFKYLCLRKEMKCLEKGILYAYSAKVILYFISLNKKKLKK